MKLLLSFLSCSLLQNISFGQTVDCLCRMDNESFVKPLKVFRLTNSIAVCGSSERKNGKIEYSDFFLQNCSTNQRIGQWDGTQTCTISQIKDTLIVQEFYPIPNGKLLSVEWRAFFVTKYYFKHNQIIDTAYFRTDLRKYNQHEIQSAIINFKKQQDSISNFDDYLLAINQLFWAYVSGSSVAEQYLIHLEKLYGTFDGGNSEAFDHLIGTFQNYKHQIDNL